MSGLSPFRFDRNELAGSLGDLGTLLPLTIALVLINSVPLATTLLLIGIMYVASGVYYLSAIQDGERSTQKIALLR